MLTAQEKEFLSKEWLEKFKNTDFEQSDIKLNLLLPPQLIEDYIPSIAKPQFASIDEASFDIASAEPVIIVKIGKDIRAYPVRYLLWHHLVSDVVGGEPIIVTFNPYTDAFAVYSRKIDDKIYDFEYSGLIYQASLVLKDLQTESLFLQVHGKGAVGVLKDEELKRLAAQYISWEKFIALYGKDDVKVLLPAEDDNDLVILGKTPLVGYDSQLDSYYYRGSRIPNSDRLRKFTRIISYDRRRNGWSVDFIKKRGQVDIRSERVRLRWEEGMVSVQDTFSLNEARNIGMVHVEKQQADGSWEPILFYRDFAFSFLSFFPGRRILHD